MLIGIGFRNTDANMVRLFRAVFLIGSAISEGCDGGVVFMSCHLGDGAVFSDAADDHPSLDVASISIPCWSDLNDIPLAGLVLRFPLSSFLYVVSSFASSPWSLLLISPTSFVVVLSKSISRAILLLCLPGTFHVVCFLVILCLEKVCNVLLSYLICTRSLSLEGPHGLYVFGLVTKGKPLFRNRPGCFPLV